MKNYSLLFPNVKYTDDKLHNLSGKQNQFYKLFEYFIILTRSGSK